MFSVSNEYFVLMHSFLTIQNGQSQANNSSAATERVKKLDQFRSYDDGDYLLGRLILLGE